MPKQKRSFLKQDYRAFHFSHWIFLLAFFALVAFTVQNNFSDFQASVIPTKTAAPFDGTTLPVLKAPDWVALTSAEWDLAYDKIPTDKLVALPTYDATTLATPTEKLGWKSRKDLDIRNAKITFSTPYMGNYKLDGIEGGGSHLAVDIKVPMDTPVYAIANGVVDKVSELNSGFGHHIVIKHENVPSLSDPNAKVTLYSSYNHLGEILIGEGEIVTKGQLIAKSGETGTATTPHVHFQIDNDQAPWHPYWPFTSKEAADAGYSFTEAINAGFAKDKALQTTINPMLYVQKYLNGKTTSAPVVTVVPTPSELPPVTTLVPPAELPPQTNAEVENIQPEEEQPSVVEPALPPEEVSLPAVSFKIKYDGSFVQDKKATLTLEAIDSNGAIAKQYRPADGVYFQILSGGADVPNYLSSQDFVDGVAEFTIIPTTDTGLTIRATDNTISGESEVMESMMFSDVDSENPSYDAIKFLKQYSVVSGHPDGSFHPESVVSRVEALKFIAKGAKLGIISSDLPFKDIADQEWYTDYVATAFSKNIVEGYPDNTFQPSKGVTRAEFIKMVLLAADIKVNPFVTRDVYKDVPMDAWFAPYIKAAKDLNIVDVRGKLFRPNDGMTRAEVAETIYRLVVLRVSGKDKYSSALNVSSSKVSAYFN